MNSRAEIFRVGNKYTRKEVREILGIDNPEKIGGIWSTGYIKHEGYFYIFTNISKPGRTGHDYNNNFDGEHLYWFIKGNHNFKNKTVVDLISGEYPIRIFCRYDTSDPKFSFMGYGMISDYNKNENWISWCFTPTFNIFEQLDEFNFRKEFIEGNRKEYTINRFERDPKARQACLDYYGYSCSVCNFNFEQVYGQLGYQFIHVHHVIELSRINRSYVVDPIKDLIPVCPNCHSILHKRKPAFSVDELRFIMKSRREEDE